MNVIQALTEVYNSESMDSVYRELSRQILENFDKMKRVTIYDIAELTNSSRTTVWRLVQKLGYGSFSDFRYALQSAASQYTYYNRMIDKKKNAGPESMMRETVKLMGDAVRLYKEKTSAESVEILADELSDVSRVYFFIPFRTSFIYSLQQNLWMDGKDTEYCCLIPDMLAAAEHLDGDSIVIMNTIEFTETQDMTAVFEKVKEKKSTLWLTGESDSRYKSYADRLVFTCDAAPAAWMLAFECFLLTLSERYRGKYIDSN